MSNCIYSKSKDANSEMVTIELPKSYCLPSILCGWSYIVTCSQCSCLSELYKQGFVQDIWCMWSQQTGLLQSLCEAWWDETTDWRKTLRIYWTVVGRLL